MSWMKRPKGSPGAVPAAEQAPYNPSQQPIHAAGAQGVLGQPNLYPNYQSAGTNPQTQQQQYWGMQQPQQTYNHQYGTYQQQEYAANNANQHYQYNQPTSNTYQQQGQQNYQPIYDSQYNQNVTQPQQQYPKANQGKDGWDDTWDWGWDENAAKQPQPGQQQQLGSQQPQVQPRQQMFQNNANVIDESFKATDSWNNIPFQTTSLPARPPSQSAVASFPEIDPFLEKKVASQSEATPVEQLPAPSESANQNNYPPQLPPPITDENNVKTLNDREVVKERIPNLALGKRFHLENLTPQWSIESQMSQESSDGPQTHSESTYRSENQSRNSSKSSPGLTADNTNFNYSTSGLDDISPQNIEWNRTQIEDTSPVVGNNYGVAPPDVNNLDAPQDALANSLKDMIIANSEVPPNENLVSASLGHDSSRSGSSPAQAVQVNANLTQTLPPSVSMPPPLLPPPTSSQNPFKRAGPISHKTTPKPSLSPSLAVSQPGLLPPPLPRDATHGHTPPASLASPSVVNKAVQQHSRNASNYPTANLETTPDNSERPDHPQTASFRPLPNLKHPPENLEVAPRNDRNEYLQTAHLSSGDFGENTNFSHNIPPPGLRRMVVGQQGSEYSQNVTSDEPPPGLSRMVPGQPTEADNSYNQPNNFMDRHIDGETTDGNRRNMPYRQADGQPTDDDDYNQSSSRNPDRRPIGLDRMVPGESSNDDFRTSQFQNTNFVSSSGQRVVTGEDHHASHLGSDNLLAEVREQNVDGSEFSGHSRNASRSFMGNMTPEVETADFGSLNAPEVEEQREVTMEGENLQDLSLISSTELSFGRDQVVEGAVLGPADIPVDRKTDQSDLPDMPTNESRRQSLNRVNTSGDDSERDRAFKASPRRDRDGKKSARDPDGRYTRDDRKDADRRPGKERDERRSEKDKYRTDRDRTRRDYRDDKDRDDRRRRSNRDRRYDTEDTDYYSDREREKRRYAREGSYTASSKPPRPEEKDRRYRDDRDRERSRRYGTSDRDRKYDPTSDDRDGGSSGRRGEMSYRDIDPERKYGSLRKNERKRGDTYSPTSSWTERGAGRTEDELNETNTSESRRRSDRHRRRPRNYEGYYEGYGSNYQDPYLLQRQQQQTYQYYEHLRLTNPTAYMQVYNKYMAGQPLPPPSALQLATVATGEPIRPTAQYEGYGYDLSGSAREERGSVHSGRSSANGMKTDMARYYAYRPVDGTYGRAAAESVRTDLSGSRDFNTDVDASLNLQLEDSTVRSERMTPYKFTTAHVKGSISRHIVLIHPSYPVDGLPATVELLDLAAVLHSDPQRQELSQFPGPLVKGVTHKKTVIEYCEGRGRAASTSGGADVSGHVLMWDLLALLLRQNGNVVGTDIAELLMKNKRQFEHRSSSSRAPPISSRRGSVLSSDTSRSELRTEEGEPSPQSEREVSVTNHSQEEELELSVASQSQRTAVAGARDAERAALDRFREHLIFGNHQEALECAMGAGLWGHAMQLAAGLERRARAAVAARFLAAVPSADPLHTLYATLAGRHPPAASCASEEKWGDWRPHLAMILSNTSTRPEVDKRAITSLGDSLASRGLVYSSQFCYLMARLEFGRHPLAPLPAGPASASAPRLALLGASPHAPSLDAFATNQAIIATEIYEYACSLSDPNFVITEFQVYKWILLARLCDCGLYARALAYSEQLACALAARPHDFSPRLAALLADMADRLKHHDPALQDDPPLVEEGGEVEGEEGSPRHTQQWLHDLHALAHRLNSNAGVSSAQQPMPAVDSYQQQQYVQQPYSWQLEQPQPTYQVQAPQQLPETPPTDATVNQTAAEYEYQQTYYKPEETQQPQLYSNNYNEDSYQQQEEEATPAPFNLATDSGYWNQDSMQQTYGYEGGEATSAPQISMPNSGARAPRNNLFDYDDDRPANDNTAHNNAQPRQEQPDEEDKRKDIKKAAGGKQAAGGGWFGGIFNKLSLKPKNQMILPDDKNPTIVWDADKKRWKNLDSDETAEETGAPPPPPRLQPALSPAPGNPSSPMNAAPPGPTSNIFKMQKGRYIKKSYVDVFNPGGAAQKPLPPAPDVLGPAPPAPPLNYFVPTQGASVPLHSNNQQEMYDPSQYAGQDYQQ